MSVWHEVISQGKTTTNGDEQASSAGLLAGNVYSFGALLLEIISGKLPTPYPAHERSLQMTSVTSYRRNTVMFLTTRRRTPNGDVMFLLLLLLLLLPRLWWSA
jgi:hypothetical protein